jgi:hypothetical protein
VAVLIESLTKASAQRNERLKVEEKILERPERTRRSREDRERIFDDGFESRSSCAEVFDIDIKVAGCLCFGVYARSGNAGCDISG